MRATDEHHAVDTLAGLGRNPSDIARLTGIPRSTVRDWLRRPPLDDSRGVSPKDPEVPSAEYAYLLGMYLGDGVISRARRCYRLRVSTDAAYPGVIAECAQAMQAVLPRNRVSVWRRTDGSRTVDVSVYSKALPILFPQHGPGKKHQRRIVLEPWQQLIVEDEPEKFLRGLIHSDGARVMNRVGGREYPRYFFKQMSPDIRAIFIRTCNVLGLSVSSSGPTQLSIARRNDVAFVDTFVGAKA
jgi:Homeodomain-like domain-containing protein